MKTCQVVEGQFHAFLTSALDCEWSAPYIAHFTPPQESPPDTQWIGGWMSSSVAV
jgi:hypothetical protein